MPYLTKLTATGAAASLAAQAGGTNCLVINTNTPVA